MGDRLRAAFGDLGSKATPVKAYAKGGPVIAPATTDRFAAWGRAFGSWGTFDGDGNAAALDMSTAGVLTGIDGLVDDKVRVGILAGFSHLDYDADGQASSGLADSYHLGIYGGTEWGQLGIRSGLAYTWSDIDINRTVALPTLANHLRSD